VLTISCGIDFGTSNTAVALSQKNAIDLVELEGRYTTIPSAMFFEPPANKPSYGREAINLFLANEEGRFMRSLKRVLGTELMQRETLINERPVKFDAVIRGFLKAVKESVDKAAGDCVDYTVMGPSCFLC